MDFQWREQRGVFARHLEGWIRIPLLVGPPQEVRPRDRNSSSHHNRDLTQGQQVRPVLHRLSIRASTVAQLGKPMVVGRLGDPNSERQFQLEVTVTKLK